MYIAPNTDIYILKNIPLGKDYENTVYYKDAATQAAAFLNYQKFHLSNYSYQRQQLGTIRVELKYEQLYDCNYLMFKNTSFEDKWFYCFITGISYINDEVSEIYYEMDVMQTWCYDYHFLTSYVARRHADHDLLGYNTQPEGLELGTTYMLDKALWSKTYLYNNCYFCLIASEAVTIPAGVGVTRWAIEEDYGLACYSSNEPAPNGFAAIKGLIDEYNKEGKASTILWIYRAPNQVSIKQEVINCDNSSLSLANYKPRNYKLLTSPFVKIRLSNNAGLVKEFNVQDFTTLTSLRFVLAEISFPTPGAYVFPANYQNVLRNYVNQGISVGNFPQVATTNDAFKQWWALNQNTYSAAVSAACRNYDTNMAIAQNNYNMANRTAQATAAQSNNLANAQLANANATNNTALANAQNTYNAQTTSNTISGAVGTVSKIFDFDFGSAATSGINALLTQNEMDAQLKNAQASAATASNTASTTAAAVMGNAQIALSAAMKNNATALASSQLSGLTAKENAIEAAVAKKQDMENSFNTAVSVASDNYLMFNTGVFGFNIERFTIKYEYAERIDVFFDTFGYAQNRRFYGSLLDHRLNRPHYTYLKTIGCNIRGGFNKADQQTIQEIYNNGITTWDKLENIGRYEYLNNEADHEGNVDQ